ncbi:MAG: hypothetical protein V3R96_02545 [Dehalococcoidales bacterium]
MYQKLGKSLKNLHRGQRGMTGLETAIILIAFVTVASVLAYSVLSAGIFSAERGKATVYGGLEQASATLELKSHVLVTGDTATNTTDYIYFLVGLTIPEEKVDMEGIVVKFSDNATEDTIVREDVWATWNATSNKWTSRLLTSKTERGTANMLEGDEIHEIRIDLPSGATVTEYQTFLFELLPPKGGSITIKRTIPGSFEANMDLN